ncbi:hypothetical protein Tco_0217014 [Tanacetum coccineum]
MRQGWDPRYKIWVEHGEPAPPTPPPVIDNTRQPLMSDMTTLLNDLSYIPPNNEHNEPTQGDIGETSNEPTQATRNEFEELYASANEELYPGCDNVTRLDFMAKFTYFKAKGRLTDSIFNEMLEFFQNVFPISKGFKLPPSYYAIKKTFKTIGLGYESIHACEHDCCLFRGDNNKDLDFCPVCNTSRWKDSNTPGKKVPKKVLRYFPVIPRLQRLYKSSHTIKDMIWHATGKCTEPGKMQHPVDGGAWKKFDTKYPDFAKEPRNVRLGLAADGFNPFGNLSQAYSMWPVILTTYNLPPWLCMKESSFMLTLLIPGPKSPGKDIDVYLRPLIEDLKVLWDRKGVETIDVASGQKFNMRAMVLWTINDFPARSSLSGWSGQGYKACPTCNEDTPSVRLLSKTAYVAHRRFLKKPHKWRRSLEFNGQTDNKDPPKEFGRDVILAQLDRLPTRVKGKHPSHGGVKIKRNVHVELNWTKRSIFYELEYWSFLSLRHNLDIMHIEKNVLEAILNTLLMNDKSKDTAKARQDLQMLGIRSGLWLSQTKNGKCLKPQAAYSAGDIDNIQSASVVMYEREFFYADVVLWDRKGVETIDVASGQKFNMRAMVLWTINDFPARSSLSGWSGQGYKACPTCNEDTPSVRVLSKTAYVGHRRFLKKPHKWRRSLEFNGQTDNTDPPKEFSRDVILAQLDRLPTRVKGKHPSYGGVKIKRNVHVELNWTKRSIFTSLSIGLFFH